MKNKVSKIAWFIFGLSFVSFLSGGTWTYLLSKDRSREAYKNLSKLTRVYDLVKENYVQEPADEKLIDGAIRGMLEELDPHSVYLTKKEFSDMQADTRGEFGGLGIEITKKDDMLTIVSPIEDTPAAKAGLQAGDVIVKIEDKPTARMSIFEAVEMMRGKPGTSVTITIKRQGRDDLLPVKLTRAIIQVKSVKAEMREGFGIIRIGSFVDRTSDELRKALNAFKKEGPIKGLVLDLRNNPGGLLQQAIEVADIFLSEGMIVYTQGREADRVTKSFAMSKGTEPNYPIVVIINGGSASASEIVAGALQDHKRAHLIGTTSFGKGSVQNVIPLEDGSGIKLTVALYYTPAGRQIQGEGIVPDEIVRGPNDPEEVTREKDLPGHIVGVNEKNKEAAKKKAHDKDEKVAKVKAEDSEAQVDVQLEHAIAYLKRKTAKANLDRSP